jgi:hypothetical protein
MQLTFFLCVFSNALLSNENLITIESLCGFTQAFFSKPAAVARPDS